MFHIFALYMQIITQLIIKLIRKSISECFQHDLQNYNLA